MHAKIVLLLIVTSLFISFHRKINKQTTIIKNNDKNFLVYCCALDSFLSIYSITSQLIYVNTSRLFRKYFLAYKRSNLIIRLNTPLDSTVFNVNVKCAHAYPLTWKSNTHLHARRVSCAVFSQFNY